MHLVKKVQQTIQRWLFIYRYFQSKKDGKLVPKERALARIGNMITLIEQVNQPKK